MSLAFDIGGNRGQSIDALFLKNYTTVISVEANPVLANMLCKKYEQKLGDTVFIEPKIVCEHDRGKKLYIALDEVGISTTKVEWATESRFKDHVTRVKTVFVESITLDQLIEQYGNPSFIKIDVEGGEMEVLQGLSFCDAKIAFEWTEELFDSVVETSVSLLRKLGYRQFSYQENDTLSAEPSDTSYTSWEECDIHSIINKNNYKKWGLVWAKK